MRRIYLNILFLIVLMLNISNVFAQQDIMTSSKMENLSLLNPAYKSATDRATFIFQHRSQWVGFDGAPTTDIVAKIANTITKIFLVFFFITFIIYIYFSFATIFISISDTLFLSSNTLRRTLYSPFSLNV